MLRLAVIGKPVAHSLSPAIHTAALSELGLEGTYQAIETDPQGLPGVIERLRSSELTGVNVTMPLKRPAARSVDALDDDAARAGSVNTIVRRDGRLIGYSTDVSALRRLWPCSNRPTLVLGTGGAARAALVAAPPGSVFISGRDGSKARVVAEEMDRPVEVVGWDTSVVDAVVVNATTLGMKGERLPDRPLELAAGLIDLPYAAGETPAIRRAAELSLPTVDGLEVLLAQAADSFRLWTGREAPVGAMREAVANP